MKDKTLLNISLMVTVVGIVALLLLSYFDLMPEKSYNEITSKDISSRVKVSGIVKQVYKHNSTTTLKLTQECTMDVMMFATDQNITAGDKLSVEGTVQEYNGKMEIVADRITKK